MYGQFSSDKIAHLSSGICCTINEDCAVFCLLTAFANEKSGRQPDAEERVVLFLTFGHRTPAAMASWMERVTEGIEILQHHEGETNKLTVHGSRSRRCEASVLMG